MSSNFSLNFVPLSEYSTFNSPFNCSVSAVIISAPNDPSRGKNASNKTEKLFSAFDITLFASTGLTYEVMDKLDLFAGIMFNKGFANLVNPNLRFAEPNQTKVNSDISWKAFLVGMELGVAYRIQ